ncbi:hypothetical protein L596_028286 [Steinernema carpocapsae]|uniref:Uncharacterized protein n=1 Tax=Steinernema carpocapsae TaxID=34508 RepID=A0A4U5LY38_STECR|nr:hypothetical protein L596_028286 [Steinernema carpocapsae]
MDQEFIPVVQWNEKIRFIQNAEVDKILQKLTKVPFPAATRRAVEGGDGGDFVKRNVQLTESNYSETAKGIYFKGILKTHVDGDVAYIPSEQSRCLIIVQIPEGYEQKGKLVAVEIPATFEAVIVGAGVYHSLPIALEDKLVTFLPIFRETNIEHTIPAVVGVDFSAKEDFCLKKVDLKATAPADLKLAEIFANNQLKAEIPTEENFAIYGNLFENIRNYAKHVACLPFKGHKPTKGSSLLSQDFKMEWIAGDAPNTKKIQFTGLTGSFAGGQGCPGVVRDSSGVIAADLIMTRPDGSFCIEPIAESDEFLMFVAVPNADDKEPKAESLKAFMFKGITPVLKPEVWHSVPIPVGEKIIFKETISITNANVVINVRSECGKPMKAQI